MLVERILLTSSVADSYLKPSSFPPYIFFYLSTNSPLFTFTPPVLLTFRFSHCHTTAWRKRGRRKQVLFVVSKKISCCLFYCCNFFLFFHLAVKCKKEEKRHPGLKPDNVICREANNRPFSQQTRFYCDKLNDLIDLYFEKIHLMLGSDTKMHKLFIPYVQMALCQNKMREWKKRVEGLSWGDGVVVRIACWGREREQWGKKGAGHSSWKKTMQHIQPVCPICSCCLKHAFSYKHFTFQPTQTVIFTCISQLHKTLESSAPAWSWNHKRKIYVNICGNIKYYHMIFQLVTCPNVFPCSSWPHSNNQSHSFATCYDTYWHMEGLIMVSHCMLDLTC